MGRNMVQKSPRVLELDVVSALSAQVSTLTNQVNQKTMIINKQQAQPVKQVQIFCEVCGEGHMSNLCPANPESVYFVGNANRGQTNQYGDTYNPNWRNHPNISWGGNPGNQNQYRPQAPQQQSRPPQDEQQASLEEMMKKLMADQQALNQKLIADQQDFNQKLIADQQTFNQKIMADQQAQATALRNLEHHVGQLARAQNTRPAGALPSDTEPNPKAQVNAEVPKYARYLRDIVANKRRHAEFEIVALTEECSDKVQRASINLVPYSLFKQLRLGALRPTTITLQLANWSLVMPEGIIEDVQLRKCPFLGRPFLATGGVIIDVRAGKLKMRVDDEEVTFNMYKALKLPTHYEDLCMITVVESKEIEQSPYVKCSDPDGTTELEEVVLQAECVRTIAKRARDERGDLPRVCKKSRLYGRKKKRKRPA
ncbi:PREDICTED: uncharacterized protein LOC109237363 [Nicotiana attenuata]|uniref:uncharacterized protein LOC109237363 n=1 Tax=Nicotiana attenuata TaxID=49451 RepID=UPI000904A634|nr:PREDICTED: uncharacterized protein LOC109237363 [Nicotiana attenuata]